MPLLRPAGGFIEGFIRKKIIRICKLRARNSEFRVGVHSIYGVPQRP